MVHTQCGALTFQHYFVRNRAEPVVFKITYEGADGAQLSPEILAALRNPGLQAIVIAPSNPFLSIDPILGISGARAALRQSHAPIIAVTPIIGGAAVKGPTAKIMRELGMPVTATAVAEHYGDLIDGFVLDQVDVAERGDIESRGPTCTLAPTLMRDDADKIALAERVLAFANHCPRRRNAA
jgi:LPPG:FO 2-phospho-L-lactate transferase